MSTRHRLLRISSTRHVANFFDFWAAGNICDAERTKWAHQMFDWLPRICILWKSLSMNEPLCHSVWCSLLEYLLHLIVNLWVLHWIKKALGRALTTTNSKGLEFLCWIFDLSWIGIGGLSPRFNRFGPMPFFWPIICHTVLCLKIQKVRNAKGEDRYGKAQIEIQNLCIVMDVFTSSIMWILCVWSQSFQGMLKIREI